MHCFLPVLKASVKKRRLWHSPWHSTAKPLPAGSRAEGEPIEPCGTCRPCKKIAAGHHPDVIIVEPEQSRIKISAIRDLGNALAVKPYEALQRVVVIDQAQAMNPQAGNSLLKLLEEPPAKTILILIAVNTYSLLPTIVSRCQQVSFKPIPDQTLAEYLRQKGIPPEKADILGKLANGSFAKAESLAETDWLGRREWVIRVFERLGDDKECGRRAALSMAFSEMLAKDQRLDRRCSGISEILVQGHGRC